MEQAGGRKWGISFKPELTVGNVISLVTIVSTLFASYYGIKDMIKESTTDRAELHREINDMQADRKETKAAIFKMLNDAHEMDQTQNNRIDTYADRVKQLLDITIEQGKQIHDQSVQFARMHEDFALFKFALKTKGFNVPSPNEDQESERK